MSDLRQNFGDYLTIRRSLGFKLVRTGLLLADFVDYAERGGVDIITTELAFSWATLPPGGAAAWWAQRLGVVRGFARHLHAIDPAHEVPPTDLIVGRSRRATPYPYSAADIEALMTAAGSFRSPLRVCTFETLVGLLATTGMRSKQSGSTAATSTGTTGWSSSPTPSSARAAWSPCTRPRSMRSLPTTVVVTSSALVRGTRAFSCPRPAPGCTTAMCTRLGCSWSERGLDRISPRCRPRPDDLRHRFAVNTLIGWYRDGVDVQARFPCCRPISGTPIQAAPIGTCPPHPSCSA